jgi:hypothetical protein
MKIMIEKAVSSYEKTLTKKKDSGEAKRPAS